MKKFMAALVLVLATTALVAPAALAARNTSVSSQQIIAQECQIGEVCITDEQTDFGGPSIDPKTVADASGHNVRSLIMLGLLATGFVVYLRLALVRGAKIG